MIGAIFLAPFSITFLNKPVLVVVLAISLFFLALKIAANEVITLNTFPLQVIVGYLSIFVFGFISLALSTSADFGLGLTTESLGRLFTITVVSSVLLMGMVWLSSAGQKDLEQLKLFWLLPGAVFLLFALYQLFCNLTGRPFIIDTRDWMHGVPKALQAVVPKRLTSIAEEPSFYAPVLIEFALMSLFLLDKTKWRVIAGGLSALVLLFTFSGGGYVNAALLVVLACVLLCWKNPKSPWLWAAIGIAVVMTIAIFSVGQVLIDFAVNKFLHESSGGSSRAQFMSDLMEIQSSAGFLQLLIGHGLTSMSYLSEFGMRSEDVLFRISNNMYLDVLWESGVLGALGIVLMYGSLLIQAFKIQIQLPGKLSLSLLLVAQSMITSLYRSEYISTHLIWMLLVISWAIYWEKGQLWAYSENKVRC